MIMITTTITPTSIAALRQPINIISLMEYPDRLCGGGGGGILLCLLSTCILMLIAGNEGVTLAVGTVRSVISGLCGTTVGLGGGRGTIDGEYML